MRKDDKLPSCCSKNESVSETVRNQDSGKKTIGIVLVSLLVLSLGLLVYSSRGVSNSGVTGAASAPTSASNNNQGFSSYAEMMKAHHGSAASSSAGSDGESCGGVASGDAKASFAGTMSEYSITYDDAGYQKLLQAEKAVPLGNAKKVTGLNILLPCCGVSSLQASDNCQCGHHVAMFGLAKLLDSKGYSREAIQVELNKWKEVFYPGGASSSTGGC